MPSIADIKAGGAFVELYTKNSKFYKGLNAAQYRLKKWGSSVTAMGRKLVVGGAAVISPFLLASKVFARMGDDLNKMSARTGIAVESLSELSFAAAQGGADIETLERGIKGMQKSLYMAEQGSKETVDALAAIGLTAEDLQEMAPEDQFTAIAAGIEGIANSTRKAAVAMTLMRESGRRLLPMLDGLAAKRQEARDLGLVISAEDAKRAAKFTDQLGAMAAVMKTALFTAGSSVAEMLGEWTMKVARAIKIGVEWMKENKALLVSVFKLSLVVLAAGTALIGLAMALSLAGAAVGGMMMLMAAYVAVVDAVFTVVSFLLTPIGLLTVALVGLAGYEIGRAHV